MAQDDLQVVRASTQWYIINNPASALSEKLNRTFSTDTPDPNAMPEGEQKYAKQVVYMEFDDGTFFAVQAFKDGYRSYANKALSTFVEQGGTIEGGDDIIIPPGQTYAADV